ncbi:MAG: winged helix-turn-helix domain-containing protein [Candidatus Micrarchaeia archaeon]
MVGIAIDRPVRKALSSENRVRILKLIASRRRTQSELARALSLSSPTVLEHLLILLNAGLIEKIDEGRKWKYYQLTEKGRALMGVEHNPVPIRSIVLFAISIMLLVPSIYMLGFYVPHEALDVYGLESEPQAHNPDVQPQMKLFAMPTSNTTQDISPPEANDPGYELHEKGIYYIMLVLGIITLAMAVYTYISGSRR